MISLRQRISKRRSLGDALERMVCVILICYISLRLRAFRFVNVGVPCFMVSLSVLATLFISCSAITAFRSRLWVSRFSFLEGKIGVSTHRKGVSVDLSNLAPINFTPTGDWL